MKLLADENIPRILVDWLREEGHDVIWIAQDSPASEDIPLLDKAHLEERILITQDLDFGELVFRHNLPAAGVMQLRLGTVSAANFLRQFQQAWGYSSARLAGHFVVVTEGKIRVQPLSFRRVK